jgi:hypothetical protein
MRVVLRCADDALLLSSQTFATKSAMSGLMRCTKNVLFDHLVGDGEHAPGGTVRLSALAVFMLMTSSNLVGCTIGRSAGFSPLRIRPARMPVPATALHSALTPADLNKSLHLAVSASILWDSSAPDNQAGSRARIASFCCKSGSA